ADVAGEQTGDRPYDEAQERAGYGEQQHDVTAVENAAEDVAAQLVDAERVLPAHARQRHAGSKPAVIIGRPEGADDRREDVDRKNDSADAKTARCPTPQARKLPQYIRA